MHNFWKRRSLGGELCTWRVRVPPGFLLLEGEGGRVRALVQCFNVSIFQRYTCTPYSPKWGCLIHSKYQETGQLDLLSRGATDAGRRVCYQRQMWSHSLIHHPVGCNRSWDRPVESTALNTCLATGCICPQRETPLPGDGYARTMQIMRNDRQVLCRDCSSLASATGVAAATHQTPNTSSRSPTNPSVSKHKINIPKSVFAHGGGKFFLYLLQSECKGICNCPLPRHTG